MNERIAAIDIGSNSFHIVVVEINPITQSFKVLDKLRETVRFESFIKPNHDLSKLDMKKGTDTLKRFKKLAEGHNVTEIFGSATSAVREAPNGKEWLSKIRKELGIEAHPISGIEEARLIYLGVLSSLELKSRKIAIIDIGGGSTELIVGDEQFIYHLSSTKVGAVRLTQKDLQNKEINTKEEIEFAEKHIESLFETKIQEAKDSAKFDFLVGTSGTVRTLAKIDYMMKNFVDDDTSINLNQYKLSMESICTIIEKLIKTPTSKRADKFGISKNRSEIILGGALILKVIMKKLGIDYVKYSDRALREGLIVDRLLQKDVIKNRLNYQQTIRERSVHDLAYKYSFSSEHAYQVKRLCGLIFDQTKDILHNYTDAEKELLGAACILHDIGSWVSHNDHHKHTYYLIKNSGLLGFNEEEVMLIANFTRYHRQSHPKENHSNFQNLSREHKKIVRELSCFLRIAEGLDKGHKSAVKDLKISYDSGKKKLKFNVTSNITGYDCALELWSAIGKSKDLQREFNIGVDFDLTKKGKRSNRKVNV